MLSEMSGMKVLSAVHYLVLYMLVFDQSWQAAHKMLHTEASIIPFSVISTVTYCHEAKQNEAKVTGSAVRGTGLVAACAQ